MSDNLLLIAWNVNGYNSKIHEYTKNTLISLKPDILFLNETKKSSKYLESKFSEFANYDCLINAHTPHWFHGVAMLIHKKHKFKHINTSLDIKPRFDTKTDDACTGRVISILLNDNTFIVGTYVPNAGNGSVDKMEYRINEWDIALSGHLNACASVKPTIWLGDINVALDDIDVSSPNTMCRNAGYTPLERKSFSMFYTDDWVDVWRSQHPGVRKYSWVGKRYKDYGMRLDNIIVSKSLKNNMVDSYMIDDCPHSDHIPICAIIKS